MKNKLAESDGRIPIFPVMLSPARKRKRKKREKRKKGVIAPRALLVVDSALLQKRWREALRNRHQVRVSNHLKLLWTKALVVSVEEKAYRICQVWIKKVSAKRTNVRIEKL